MNVRLACVACMAVCIGTMQVEGVNAFSYVQKGLAACYDGIENAGAGVHDPNATTWVDLTGSGDNGAMGSGMTWTATGWTRNADGAAIATGKRISRVTGSRTFTAECVVAPSRDNVRQTFFGQWASTLSCGLEHNTGASSAGCVRAFYYWTPDFLTSSALTVKKDEFATLGMTTTPQLQCVWKNGATCYRHEYLEGFATMALNTNCVTYIGGDSRSGMAFRGTFHAFRLYDRVLTADELALNAAVDAVRFKGADPAAVTVPAGWAFDAQTNLLATVSVAASGAGTVQIGAGPAVATATAAVPQDGTTTSLALAAAPDAGYEFLCWEGDTDAIASGAVTDANVTLAAGTRLSLLAVFRPASGAGAIPSTAGRYVTDGLVVHLDGADNAGAGTHDPSATTWTDLSGNGNHGTVAAGIAWAANGWVNSADGRPVLLTGTQARDAIATKTFTLEFACRPARKSDRECFFGGYNTGGLSIEHNAGGVSDGRIRLYYDGAPDSQISGVTQDAGEDAVFALVSGPSEQKLYKNGTLVHTVRKEITASRLGQATYYIGGEPSRTSMAFRGTYHSFRLYNRLLTAEEVAQNAAADRARLIDAGIASLASTTWTKDGTGSWMDAAGWDYGVPNAYTPASVTGLLASAEIAVTQTVPAPKGLVLGNASGTTRVRVANGGELPLTGATTSVEKGGELAVEEGGALRYDGSGTSFTAADAPIHVNGGRLSLNGGNVNVDNLRGGLICSASGTATGTLSIARGALNMTLQPNGRHGLSISGGRLEMTGGRVTVSTPHFYDSWTALVSNYGSAELSGDSAIQFYNHQAGMSSGTLHLRDGASVTVRVVNTGVKGDNSEYARFRIAPYINGRAVVTVDDDAAIDLLGENSMFYIGGESAGSVSILNWNSSRRLNGSFSFAVGFRKGYGELNVTRGQIVGGGFGLRVAQCGGAIPQDAGCVTGVVNVTGGSLLNDNETNNAETMQGLVVGAGTVVNQTLPDLGCFRGTINLAGGAVTNKTAYTGLGLGPAEGDVVQTGGEFRHEATARQMIMGAFGGEGRYVLSNGVALAKSDVFVGGVTTNLLAHKPYGLYKYCPVTNHCAKGLLRVAGGSFSTAKTLWVSQDGAGVLEIGPAGSVTAANVTLTNTPAARTGGADLAAKVRFTCGPQGVGTLTAAGAFTIGPGATLEVDSTALEARGVFPLISFGSCEGEFASVTVTGRGTVVKTGTGYVLDRLSGTTILVR